MNLYTDYEYIASSKYFDKEWYLKEYPDVATNWKEDPALHYLLYGWKEGRNPGKYFDGKRYLTLARYFEVTDINPLVHYEKYGRELGLIAPLTPYVLVEKSKYFSKRWYKHEYLKKEENIDPIEHYIKIGWKKNYNPSLKFDTRKYLEKYPGVAKAGICPLVHYERNGKFENRMVTPCIMPSYEKHNYWWKMWQRVVNLLVKPISNRYSPDKKILVCLHLFYPDSWCEIEDYLHNLDNYQYDLVVSYPKELECDEVIDRIRKFNSSTKFYECENRGFDVGPFIEMLSGINLEDYDIVIKLHSKGISRPRLYMYGRYVEKKEWFEQLFRGVVGIFNTHRTIKKLRKNKKKIGMVACTNLIVRDPIHKQNLTKEWCEKLEVSIPNDYHFVAGTCFAVRAELLSEIKALCLSLTDFETTTRGEFSLAHGIERIICIVVENEGYKIEGNNVFKWNCIIRKLQAYKQKKYAAIRLLKDSRFTIDDNFFYRVMEGRQIEDYELVSLPLKEIRRIWNGKKIPLDKCHPYRYLSGYRNEYYDYCDFHKDSDLPLMTKQRFDDLIESLTDGTFDSRYKVIVNQDNVIQDGQHRACYYLYKYGSEYEIEVLKVHYRGQGKTI